MRLMLEITVLALLLYLGWEKPFRRWVHSAPEESAPAVVSPARPQSSPRPVLSQSPSRSALRVKATPTPARGNWMWNEKEQISSLERGPNNPRSTQSNGPSPKSYHLDENGRRYWLDQNGARHYF